jgi:hypothetical protein
MKSNTCLMWQQWNQSYSVMNKLYNIEIYNGKTKVQTLYLNASYAICVSRKKVLLSQGIMNRAVYIVPVA